MTLSSSREPGVSTQSGLVVDVASYDRSPELTMTERTALEYIASNVNGRGLDREYQRLGRLIRPVYDVLDAHSRPHPSFYLVTRRRICIDMHRRRKVHWGWSEEEWIETIVLGGERCHRFLLAIAYVLGGISGHRLLEHDRHPVETARRVFGNEAVNAALERVGRVVEGWGYDCRGDGFRALCSATCRALLVVRSARLEDLTLETILSLREFLRRSDGRTGLELLSRVLASLDIVAAPIPRKGRDTEAGDSVSAAWREWCDRWLLHLTLVSRRHVHMYLLKVGRWLAAEHPDVESPEQWTREFAVEYLAAVDRMKTGEWGISWARQNPNKVGKPSQPRSKDHQIYAARVFFRDLQDWGWIPVRFDPGRYLRTPKSVASLIGPDPRVIDHAIWAKLIAAGLDLRTEDLPRVDYTYPLELLRALTAVWLLTGLRSDEVTRLRLGCIRWQKGDVTMPGTNNSSPSDSVCLLDVPVNKTSTAFTKPVSTVVGQRIDEWERLRPADQQIMLDPKTGELVSFLFCYRNRRVPRDYLNNSLIPILCRKAGVPESDARGRITSHRARATIASHLYNGPEPWTLAELQAWLGHKDPKSTQSYAQVNPTRLAKKYTNSEYLERKLAMVQVLLDVEELKADGKQTLYYELGHGLCANPYWRQCPYRMACVRCEFYVPGERAQYVRAKQGIRHMLETIPLTDEEREAAESDEGAINSLIEKNAQARPSLSGRGGFNSTP